jgi:hypothetical protein
MSDPPPSPTCAIKGCIWQQQLGEVWAAAVQLLHQIVAQQVASSLQGPDSTAAASAFLSMRQASDDRAGISQFDSTTVHVGS